MSINKVELKNCIICQNCKNVCPVTAISLTKEEKTFMYPEVEEDKCIGCGLCEKVCPVLTNLPRQPSILSGAAKNKNVEVRKASSSGGIFSLLAEQVICENGIVYGAIYDEDYHVCHVAARTEYEVIPMRGSKYVQSRLGVTFLQIEKELKQGGMVLFSGSPCQSAALNVYLDRKKICKDNLYIMSFICHGILSEKLFDQYKQFLYKKRKSQIKSFSFVCKEKYGWEDRGLKIVYQNGKVDQWPCYEDIYMQGYFQAICMRESCYTCKYKDFHEGSDILVGDIWGARQIIPEFFDNNGVSFVSIQTQKGQRLFESIRERIEFEKYDIEKLAQYNQGLYRPFRKGEKHDEYYQNMCAGEEFALLKDISESKGVKKIKGLIYHFRREVKILMERKANRLN